MTGLEGEAESTSSALRLPARARTRNGAEFDPRGQTWSFRDADGLTTLNFGNLPPVTASFLLGLKGALLWVAEAQAPSTLQNGLERLRHLLRFMSQGKADPIASICALDLISYNSSLPTRTRWYLSSLSGLIKKWHRLGYPGIDDDAVALLGSMRLRGNEKGAAVLTMDGSDGPLTDMEREALEVALNDAYARGNIDTENYLLVWLILLLGQRPVQYAALKVCDVLLMPSSAGESTYLLRVPRAKQRNATWRAMFKHRPLHPHIGALLFAHAGEVQKRFIGILDDPDQAPLFPGARCDGAPLEMAYHRTPASITDALQASVASLGVYSERNGEPLHVHSMRLRRTLGTRAAAEGHGPLVIAEILDHNDTQNVHIYSEATPAFVERIDHAVAMRMAPLAQAFAGVLVRSEAHAIRGDDPASRIFDARIDQECKPMGTCGQHGFCGLLAPIACYTCMHFQPWLDGPHEAVLDHLIEQRKRLLVSTDKRIAAINDRTILAVAEVVRICERVRQQGKESASA
mgnify:FL=1